MVGALGTGAWPRQESKTYVLNDRITFMAPDIQNKPVTAKGPLKQEERGPCCLPLALAVTTSKF